MLTALGFFGNMIVFSSFILATYIHKDYLLLGVSGFAVSWFGDSLDGRVAYFRKNPRKKYGLVLDITIDWISIIIIGCGYIIYSNGFWELLGYGFVVMYGWEMIITLIRYKIAGEYSIDSGKLGPTEARIIISVIMVAEVIFRGSIIYSVFVMDVVMFIVNVIDTRKLLQLADNMDKNDKEKNYI
jgi:phosphatidylglycerophosphate synthase